MSLRAARPVATLAAAPAAALAALVVTGCGNPAADTRIEALGGENPNVEPSEYHRPGQPCVLCHDVYEGADPQLSIGGTVFADQQSLLPVEGVQVVLTDTRGITKTVTTNCVGNFFVEAGTWDETGRYPDPQYPLAADIRCPTYDPETGAPILDPVTGEPVVRVKSMGSVISRDGSCASCHDMYKGATIDSTGIIYCNAPGEVNPFPPIRPDCPGEGP